MKKFFSLIAAVLFAGSMMATTVTKTVEELATANSWENGVVVTPFALDEVISVSTEATDANTGKYYTSGQQIRLYQTGAAKMIVSAAEGYTISSITLTYVSQNTGIFVEAESGVAVDFENVQSATFTVGNSGEATNGQARVTSISVTYDAGGEVPPTPSINYYVAGSMNGWAADEAYMLTPNNQSLYEGEFTFAANDEFKVIGFDGTNTSWFPEGMGNNFQITEAGDYKITFNPAGNVEGWYEGFFNVVKKEEPVVPGEEINVTISSLTNPGQVLYADVIASSGYWDIYAFNDQYQIEISNISTTEAAGTYTIDDLDADFTYIVPAEGDTVHFTAGQVVLSITDGVVNVAGQLTGDDNNIYNVNLTYKDPVAEQTVNVNITEGVLYNGYAAYGLYAVYGSAEDGTYVQLAIWTEAGFEGQFTEEDLDNKYVGSGLKDAAGNTQQIYAAAITVTPGAIEGAYTITADLLCYNNTLYKVTMKIGEEQGIDNVDAAVKAIKRLVNGQLVIEKAGKTYNINGAVVR